MRVSREKVLRPLVVGLCLITLLMPVVTWLISTGGILAYFSRDLPPGQTLYVFSKLLGLVTIVLLWLQLMAALAKSSPVLQGFLRLTPSQHALLGIGTFASACTHATLFILATSLRAKHSTLDLLLPTFTNGYYSTFVSFGAIALWTLLVVLLAGWRRAIGKEKWRWVHRFAFLVFALGFIHGITVGSETRFGLMTYVYAFMGLSICAAVLSLIWVRMRRPRIVEGTAHVAVVRD